MAVFIEKPLVTSPNCYETMKNASILMKHGTTVDWTIASVTACSVLNFCYHGNGGGEHLKIAKNHYFALFFALISNGCNFSMD
jgi:gamma-glutamyltranspeptidase